MRWVRRLLVALTAFIGLATAVEQLYRRLLRDWVLTWGATAEEVTRRLPGDELLEEADVVATRAIGIEAPPSAIWPWLVQMGPGRAGAYTYDWIENLFGLNMHSADRIHAEWQNLRSGTSCAAARADPGCGWRSSTPNGCSQIAPRQVTGSGPLSSSPKTARRV